MSASARGAGWPMKRAGVEHLPICPVAREMQNLLNPWLRFWLLQIFAMCCIALIEVHRNLRTGLHCRDSRCSPVCLRVEPRAQKIPRRNEESTCDALERGLAPSPRGSSSPACGQKCPRVWPFRSWKSAGVVRVPSFRCSCAQFKARMPETYRTEKVFLGGACVRFTRGVACGR